MPKQFSNKILKTNDRLKRTYYLYYSALRYSRRFVKYRSRSRANVIHSHLQRQELKDKGQSPDVLLMTDWLLRKANHAKKFNTRRIKMEAEQAEREARNRQLHEQEVTEKAQQLLNKAISQ